MPILRWLGRKAVTSVASMAMTPEEGTSNPATIRSNRGLAAARRADCGRGKAEADRQPVGSGDVGRRQTRHVVKGERAVGLFKCADDQIGQGRDQEQNSEGQVGCHAQP